MTELLWCLVGGLMVAFCIGVFLMYGATQVVAELARRIKVLEDK